MGTPGTTSGTAPAVVRRSPRPATVTLLALYVAAAAVGLAVGGAVERLTASALLAVVALRMPPCHRAVRRWRGNAPSTTARPRAGGNGNAADA